MKHAPYSKFKGAIREIGVTYEDVAKVLNLSIPTISAKVNGQSDFLISEVKILKNAYGLKTEVFLT